MMTQIYPGVPEEAFREQPEKCDYCGMETDTLTFLKNPQNTIGGDSWQCNECNPEMH